MAMEACGSAHYWTRPFRSHGHEVRLIAPQFVKPFVKSNKNDAIDAEAIGEAPSTLSTEQRTMLRYQALARIDELEIPMARLRNTVSTDIGV